MSERDIADHLRLTCEAVRDGDLHADSGIVGVMLHAADTIATLRRERDEALQRAERAGEASTRRGEEIIRLRRERDEAWNVASEQARLWDEARQRAERAEAALEDVRLTLGNLVLPFAVRVAMCLDVIEARAARQQDTEGG